MTCTHNGLIDYDGSTQEYFCTKCGVVVPEPQGWEED